MHCDFDQRRKYWPRKDFMAKNCYAKTSCVHISHIVHHQTKWWLTSRCALHYTVGKNERWGLNTRWWFPFPKQERCGTCWTPGQLKSYAWTHRWLGNSSWGQMVIGGLLEPRRLGNSSWGQMVIGGLLVEPKWLGVLIEPCYECSAWTQTARNKFC
jgi:hypothetical protein